MQCRYWRSQYNLETNQNGWPTSTEDRWDILVLKLMQKLLSNSSTVCVCFNHDYYGAGKQARTQPYPYGMTC